MKSAVFFKRWHRAGCGAIALSLGVLPGLLLAAALAPDACAQSSMERVAGASSAGASAKAKSVPSPARVGLPAHSPAAQTSPFALPPTRKPLAHNTIPRRLAQGSGATPTGDPAAVNSGDPDAAGLRSPINAAPGNQPAGTVKSSPPVSSYDVLSTSPDNEAALKDLEEVEAESKAAAGAIFVSPEKVYIKAPVLSALITLDSTMSPYALDARSERGITLQDAVQIALKNNLAIKISESAMGERKWNWISSLGNFLPTLQNEVSMQGLKGTYISPAGFALPLDAGYLNINSGYNQYLFKGGGILFTALENKHHYNAAKYGVKGTTNDVLLDATKKYWQLAENDALLQIRIKAVDLSRGLVIINEDMFHEGTNTQLDLLQAKYQMSADRQALISQQVTRRQSAIKLATSLNIDSGQDLTLKRRLIGKVRLVDKSLQPADLIAMAVASRPDLKRREQLRLAAVDKIKVARAPLMPAVSTNAAVVGTGANIANSSGGSTPLATSGGGTAGVGAVSGAGAGVPLSGSSSSGSTGKHWSTRGLFTIGLDVNWTLGGMGLTQAALMQSARYDARRQQLEYNDELNKIYQQVRDSFLSSLSAENLIIETTDALKYSEEGLRVAELRFKEGVGTYIDVLNAQKDYVNALVNKTKAVIQFNVAQAEILHAIGRLTVQTVTAKIPLTK